MPTKSFKYDYYGLSKSLTLQIFNDSGTIPPYRVVTIDGYNAQFGVQKGKVIDDGNNFALGISFNTIENNTRGEVLRIGILPYNTFGTQVNDPIYYDPATGMVTTLKLSQPIGFVAEVGLEGKIFVSIGGFNRGDQGLAVFDVQQPNTFKVGEPIYMNPVTQEWELSILDEDGVYEKEAQAVVVVSFPNMFTAATAGRFKATQAEIFNIIGQNSFTIGETYYLSDLTAGKLTTTQSTTFQRVMMGIAADEAAILIGPTQFSDSIFYFNFTAYDGQQNFTLPVVPKNMGYVDVIIDGSYQISSFTLNNNIISFNTPLTGGMKVFGKVFANKNFFKDYVRRAEITVAPGTHIFINDPLVFNENLGGRYEIFSSTNQTINATCYLNLNSTANLNTFTFSPDINNIFNNANTLNIDLSAGTIRIQNNTAITQELSIMRYT